MYHFEFVCFFYSNKEKRRRDQLDMQLTHKRTLRIEINK